MLKKKFITILIGVYIFWLCIMPYLITNTVILLCKNISHNSNYKIEFLKPRTKLSVIPVMSFYADKIVFRFKNESLFLDLSNFKLSLRVLPLLSGKFHINNLSGDKISLEAILAEDLELDKDFFNKLNNIYLKIDSASLKEFEAKFYQKEVKTPIIYKGNGFEYQKRNRYIVFKNNSMLDINGNVSKVKSNLFLPKNNNIEKTVFDVEVLNVNIAPLKDYFKHYLPKELKSLNGIIDIRANKGEFITQLKSCSINMQDPIKSMILPQDVEIKSKFNIFRNNIIFDNIDVKSQNLHVAFDGKISNCFSKTKPSIDLNVRLDKSRVEDIIDALPAFKIEEIDVYALKKYRFYGDVLANFSIQGRLPEPNIVGDFYIDNAILIKPIEGASKGATLKFNFVGKQVNFDVVIPAGYSEKVVVKGSQEIYNTKFANFVVKSSDAVNLKLLDSMLVPLHEILNFVIGPVSILNVNGVGNIDITVKGNRKNPHIWGLFNIKNGTVFFKKAQDFKLSKLDAVLKFNDQNAKFITKEGVVNNTPFDINGSCDLLGNFDFDVKSNGQNIEYLYESAKTSTLIPEIEKILPKLTSLEGLVDLDFKIHGLIKDVNDIQLNKNLYLKGLITFKNNNFEIQKVNVENFNGVLTFDNLNAEADFKALIGNLPLNIKAKIKNRFADLFVDIPKLNPNFLIIDEETRKKQYLPYLSLKGKYSGSVDEIDYRKIYLNALVLEDIPKSSIKYQSGGVINLANNKLSIKKINGYLNDVQNSFEVNLNIDDIFGEKPDTNGIVKLKTPDMSLYNEILSSDLIPDDIRKITKDYEFKKGGLDFNTKIQNNKLYSATDLSGIKFVYRPLDMPVEIINGNLLLKNDVLKLNKMNLLVDDMPILADGEVKDFLNKQNFNLYFNSKPRQEFIDKYINKNQIYPIKIKGDIVYWLRLKGTPDNYDMKAEIDMNKNSSLYYFGATIGDIENAIKVSIDSKIINGIYHKIKEFSYDKVIDSQSGRQTRLNMLKAWGGVKLLENDLVFDNLHIKTNHPTDARIFNIIFRKPNIKQGQFTSDLRFEGKLSDPKVLGDFHIFETNIPFLDTSMKNIELVFKDKIVEFNSKGEVIGNDIIFEGVLKNKLSAPYKIEKAYLYTKELDLNQIIDKLKVAEVDSVSTFESFESFDLSSIIANNFVLKADNIKLRNIHATNFEANTSLTDKGDFNVKKFNFNIAQGSLGGKYLYNWKSNDMSINLKAESISANDITWALFDLNNQIYGDLTGDVNLTCNGSDFNHCMETLSGNTIFNVKDGKMPKLGSLEYLLKAGNLVKGGLTGISINSVIDLIAPSKTGEFSDIFGSVRIKDGIARNVEISTKGEDLSLFIGGTYNFATSIADMEVLGLLSRKISTMLGPIGNLSINTLFNVIPGVDLSKDSLILEKINKIPGIELSSKEFRKFIAEIKGNINGDDYVTSFRWIN